MSDAEDVFGPWLEAERLQVPSTADIEFYVAAQERYGRPSLELGIGDGRVASRVRPDVGVDSSAPALRRCADLVGGATTLVESDAAHYKLDQRVNFSYAPQNMFNHITSSDHRVAIFDNIRQNTEPGGCLLFDAAMTAMDSRRRYNRIPVERGRSDDRVFYLSENIVDDERMLTEFRGVVETVADGVTVSRRHLPPLPRAYVPPGQFACELSEAGWHISRMWGDFDMAPLDTASSRQIWLSRKP